MAVNLKDGYQHALRGTPPATRVAVDIADATTSTPIPVTDTDTTVTIFNVTVATAGVEVSQALPANTKKFMFRARGNANLQLAFASGQSGSLFFTVRGGTVYTDNSFYSSQTLYFQSSKNGETVEIIAYT